MFLLTKKRNSTLQFLLIGLLALISPNVMAQSSLTQTTLLNGSGFYDRFGSSLILDGNTMVVGSPGASSNTGKITISTKNANGWSTTATLTAPDAAVGAQFGYNLALNNGTLVVGAPAAGGHGNVYVYTNTSGSWKLQSKLVGSDTTANDNFGQSIAINGDTLLVGAPQKGLNSLLNAGAVYMFTRNTTTNTWSQAVKLTAPDAENYARFGINVKLNADTLFISASFKTVKNQIYAGGVYIYRQDAKTSLWKSANVLTLGNAGWADFFGSNMLLSGDYLLIAANNKRGAVYDGQGWVYIYKKSPTDGKVYSLVTSVTSPDGALTDHFGTGLSFTGNRLYVGSPSKILNYIAQGEVYIFSFDGTTLNLLNKVVASNAAYNDTFGTAIAASTTDLIISAPQKKVGSNTYSGTVYLTPVK